MSFQQAITIDGIEKAIHSLGYRNESALKYRLVATIRELYGHDSEVPQSVSGIPSEDLILRLWDVDDDPESLRSKKKNLSSIKSSVNADLKRLYKEGKNPEGITIGPENVFTMSEEARDDLLANLKTGEAGTGAAALKEIKETLGILRGIVSKVGGEEGEHRGEIGSGLEEIRDLVHSLSRKMGLAEFEKESEASHGKSGSIESEESLETGDVEDPADILQASEGEIPETDPDELAEELESLAFSEEPLAPAPDAEDLMVPSEEVEYEVYEEVDDGDPEEVSDSDASGEDPLVEDSGSFAEWEEGESLIAGSELPVQGGISEGEGDALEPELEVTADFEADALEVEEEFAEAEEEVEDDVVVDGTDEGAAPTEEQQGISGADEPAEGGGDEPGVEEETQLAQGALEIEGEFQESEEEEAEEVELDDLTISDQGAAEEGSVEGEGETSDAGETGVEIDAEGASEISADTPELEEELEEAEEAAEESEIEDGAVLDSLASEEGGEPDGVYAEGSVQIEADALELEEEIAEAEEEESEESEVDDQEVLDGGTEGTSAIEMEDASEAAVDALELEEELAMADDEESEESELDEDAVFDPEIGEGAAFQEVIQGLDGEPSTAAMPDAPLEGPAGAGIEEEKKAKVLAEKFNASLSAMDRFYNQYLLIPAGEYTVGSGNGNGKAPARRVRVSEFYIGKFPVTNALFDVFVDKTGYRTVAERVGYGVVYYGRFQRKLDEKTRLESITWNSSMTSKIVPGAFWYQPWGPGSTLHNKRNHPVVQVSLEDAIAFAAWTGKRLPTEEEWEAASRTIKGYLCPWGNRFREEACNMEKSGHGDTTPVDRFVQFENEYGIADTLGNVLEWTTGRPDYQEEIGSDAVHFVAKGGGWATAKSADLTTRTELGRESHSNILGFRCVAY